MSEKIKLSQLQSNIGQINGLPSNPRFIKDARFNKLCENLKKYPKFLEQRPIVIKSWDRPVVIAGNMRFEGLKANGLKEIPKEWIKTAEDFTVEELRAFAILDNVPFGENDWDALGNDWDSEELEKWGVVSFESEDDPAAEEKAELKEEIITPVEWAHFLVSVNINYVDKLLPFIQQIKDMNFCEIESNVN